MKFINKVIDGRPLWISDAGSTMEALTMHYTLRNGKCHNEQLDPVRNPTILHLIRMACPGCGIGHTLYHHESENAFEEKMTSVYRQEWYYYGLYVFTLEKRI